MKFGHIVSPDGTGRPADIDEARAMEKEGKMTFFKTHSIPGLDVDFFLFANASDGAQAAMKDYVETQVDLMDSMKKRLIAGGMLDIPA